MIVSGDGALVLKMTVRVAKISLMTNVEKTSLLKKVNSRLKRVGYYIVHLWMKKFVKILVIKVRTLRLYVTKLKKIEMRI